MSDRSMMLRHLEARVDELAGRVRQLEQQLGEAADAVGKTARSEDHGSNMSAKEAALFLGVSGSLLARWRCDLPGGPPFIKFGRRVLYAPADLAHFMSSRRQKGFR